jgi:hypothetical protein
MQWIDYNQNGVFTDAGDKFGQATINPVSGSLIPASNFRCNKNACFHEIQWNSDCLRSIPLRASGRLYGKISTGTADTAATAPTSLTPLEQHKRRQIYPGPHPLTM